MDDIFSSLETKRLVLRALSVDDLDFVFQHFSDPDVNRYLLDEEPVTTYEQAKEIIDFYLDPTGKTYNRWGIVRKSDGQLIGTCGFHKWSRPNFRAEIGYDLSKAAWGQGFMTEVLLAVIDFGFTRMALNRIEAVVHLENVASLRLLDKLHFQKDGLLRDYYYQGGVFHDHWILSLLKKDWLRA